jgi:hypothetical protein
MIKFFTRSLNRYKLHPVALKNTAIYEIKFRNADGLCDVTGNISLTGLNDLTVAIYLPAFSSRGKNMLLIFENSILRASLELKPVLIHSSKVENSIHFFEVVRADVKERKIKKYFDILFLYLKNVTNTKSKNFIVPAKALFSLFAFCIKPRVVYTACTGNVNDGDIFPIDIAGNIFEDYYFFSVRKTSPAVQKIIREQKACLCLVPFSKKNEVYALGKHHKDGRLHFDLLNFKIFLSDEFKIPVPEFVINVNELKIADHFDCGAHKVFYARAVAFTKCADEAPLAHTPWYNL